MCMKTAHGNEKCSERLFLRNLTVEETGILNINVSCALIGGNETNVLKLAMSRS